MTGGILAYTVKQLFWASLSIDLQLYRRECQLVPGPGSPTGERLEAKALDLATESPAPIHLAWTY